MAEKYKLEDIIYGKNMSQLKEILKKNKIKGYSKFNYAQLIDFTVQKLKEAGLLIEEQKKYYKTCNNQIEIISQEEVKDIPRNKFIQLSNGNCYDVDNLVSLIISTEELNEDPIIKSEKGISSPIWKTTAEKDNIIFHPGLDISIRQEFFQMVQRKNEKIKQQLETLEKDDFSFLDKIAVAGFSLVNDNSGSYSEDPTVFMRSQEVLDGLISTLNKHPKKDIFKSSTFYNQNLDQIIRSLKDTCIHGIGNSLILLYLSFYFTIKYVLKKDINLSPYIIQINKNNYLVPQIIGNIIPEFEQSFENRFEVFIFSVFEDRIYYDRASNLRFDIQGYKGPLPIALNNLFNNTQEAISVFLQFNTSYYNALKEIF